ncbi:hypothetical protein BDZ91DRAFT_155823 [Kalaharituber pfeilii]|nr:hypothetical protein BDZ91DRAFT_155823 [Kalaharituber pfeilii]
MKTMDNSKKKKIYADSQTYQAVICIINPVRDAAVGTGGGWGGGCWRGQLLKQGLGDAGERESAGGDGSRGGGVIYLFIELTYALFEVIRLLSLVTEVTTTRRHREV